MVKEDISAIHFLPDSAMALNIIQLMNNAFGCHMQKKKRAIIILIEQMENFV